MLGETTFSSLLFRQTSFNCGGRPFHLVVSALAPPSHPLAIAALANGEVPAPTGLAPLPEQMVVLASLCSSRIVVDARKRTTGERPDADESDVRLVRRPRGGGGVVPGSAPQPPKPQLPPPPPDELRGSYGGTEPGQTVSQGKHGTWSDARKMTPRQRPEVEGAAEEEAGEAEAEAEAEAEEEDGKDEDEDEDKVGKESGRSASEPYAAEWRQHERRHHDGPPPPRWSRSSTTATMLAAPSPNRSETVSQTRFCQMFSADVDILNAATHEKQAFGGAGRLEDELG
jgi:hypothetical protein